MDAGSVDVLYLLMRLRTQNIGNGVFFPQTALGNKLKLAG